MGKIESGTVVDGEGGNDTLTISGMPPRKETAPKGIHNFLSGGKLLKDCVLTQFHKIYIQDRITEARLVGDKCCVV